MGERTGRQPTPNAEMPRVADDEMALLSGDGRSRYELVRALGAGGMGAVYLALDRWNGRRPCALKILTDPDLAEPFRGAARRAARLQHPRLPRLEGYRPPQGSRPASYAMAVCPGRPLSEVWSDTPPETRVELVADLLRILAHVHAAGATHGDLSPDNILVERTAGALRVGLIDVAGSQADEPGAVSGTLPFLAPERLAGGPGGPRADLFALGAVLHQLQYGASAYPDYPARQPGPDDAPTGDDGSALARTIRQLAAVAPEDRPADAAAALRLLATESGRRLPRVPRDLLVELLAAPPFVDHDGARAKLLDSHRAPSGAQQSRVALVGGGDGRGRSRLLEELRLALELENRTVLTAGGLTGDAPLALVRRLLDRLGGVAPALAEPDGADDESARFILAAERDPAAARRLLVHSWTEALDHAARQRDAALLVDDLDRADGVSQEILRTLARAWQDDGAQDRVGDALLVLATDRETLPAGSGLRLTLADLDRDAVEAVLRATLPGVVIEESAVQALLRRSGGLPRLLAAQGAALVRTGALRVDDRRLVADARRADDAQLPETLDELYREQRDQLPPDTLALLRAVALHPGPVDPAVACWLPPSGDRLAHLWRDGWLVRLPATQGRLSWGVASDALRRIALEGMPPEDRQALHLAAGEALETANDPAGAAHHLLAASPDGQPASAQARGRELALRAAAELAANAAPGDAYTLLSRVHPSARCPELHERLGEVCALTGRYEEGLKALDAALAAYAGGADRGACLHRAANLLRRAGRYPEALERLADARSQSALPAALVAAVEAEDARVRLMQGDYDGAARAADGARSAAPPGDEGARVRAHVADVRGLVDLYRGRFDDALAALEEARQLFATLGDRQQEAVSLSHVGLVHHRRTDLDRAVACYRAALRAAETAGDRGQAWRFAMNIGVALQEKSEPALALEYYAQALRQANVIDDRAGLLRVSTNLANLHRHLGTLDEARANIARALPLAEEAGDRLMKGYCLTLRGEAALLSGGLADAGRNLGAALRLFQDLGSVGEVCELRTDMALLAMERGEWAQAATEARTAADSAAQHGLDELRCRALTVRAEAERRRPDGDLQEANAWLDEARGLGARTGKPELAWWIEWHRFLALRDAGEAAPALTAGREALRLLDEQSRRLPEQFRAAFLALLPHARAVRELRWLERLSIAEQIQTGEVWTDASLRRLLEVNRRLAAETKLDRLLEFIMDSAIVLTGAERGFLLLRNHGGDGVQVAVARNIDHETVRNRRNKVSQGIAQETFESGESVLTTDAMADERYRSYLSVHNLKLRSVLCVPLRSGARVEGAIYLDNRFQRGAFDVSDLAALEAFGDQACLALSNSRLVSDLRSSQTALLESQTRVEELNRQLEAELERTANELRATEEVVRRQRRALAKRNPFEEIIGDSEPMRRVFGVMERVLDVDVPVLIQGESGTGKELVARAIHYQGSRRNSEFVAVNCASIPATLIESELFGHVRGAFTGADRDRRGVFEAAHRGTLLLDEIGDMPMEMQVKLLRALQSGEIQKVGDTRRINVDVRVLAATNRDLRQLVAEGRFREDLYYRLNVVQVPLPPLRERKGDIPLLVQHFLADNRTAGVTDVRAVRKDTLRLLDKYPWPGNVRELAAVIKNAALFAEGESLRPADLANYPEVLAAARGAARKSRAPEGDEIRPLADVERECIIRALAHFSGNKKQTAEQLGIDRRTLYNKISRYGIVLETSARVR